MHIGVCSPLNSSMFTVINESFQCEYCVTWVQPLKTGCRNHCPFCLSSKHVDRFPGDRSESCHGQLKAYGYATSKKGIMLYFRCVKCGFQGRNKATLDDPSQPDSYDAILRLSSKVRLPS
jgi:hypothetical protein